MKLHDRKTDSLSITIVTPFHRYFGGVEQVNEMLIRLLQEEGHRVTVCSSELLRKNPLFTAKRRFFGLNRLLAAYFSRCFAAETDIVICNGEFGFGINHIAAIDCFHGSYYGYAKAVQPYIPKRDHKHLIKLAKQQKEAARNKLVVSVSRHLSDILSDQGITVDYIIDNAIDTDRFRPVEGSERNNRCLFVGAMDYYGKGIDILEKLADRGIVIDCITSGRPADSRLNWLGNIPNADLPDYYRRYKSLILPSRFEGNSLVVLEAMACGTPVITTAVGLGPDLVWEIPEFVAEGTSETLPAAVTARLNLIEDRHDDFAFKARDYVIRHHSHQQWKKKWLEVIDQASKKIVKK